MNLTPKKAEFLCTVDRRDTMGGVQRLRVTVGGIQGDSAPDSGQNSTNSVLCVRARERLNSYSTSLATGRGRQKFVRLLMDEPFLSRSEEVFLAKHGEASW